MQLFLVWNLYTKWKIEFYPYGAAEIKQKPKRLNKNCQLIPSTNTIARGVFYSIYKLKYNIGRDAVFIYPMETRLQMKYLKIFVCVRDISR